MQVATHSGPMHADDVFAHPGRFIGGAKSLVGARRLAEIALFESWTEVVA